MPLSEVKTTKEASIVGWIITESADELEFLCKEIEHQDRSVFHLESRYCQHLVTMLMHHHLFGGKRLTYLANGKPMVENGNISISHSGSRVVMMKSEIPCGIDIELIHPRIRKVTKKFLNDDELLVHAETSVENLIRLWTAKEAMFKVHGTDTVFMRSNIFVELNSPEKAKARLIDGNLEIRRNIRFQINGDMMLAWTEPADES